MRSGLRWTVVLWTAAVGCAGAGRVGDAVRARVSSEDAGFVSRRGPAGELVLTVNDFVGTSQELSWPSGAGTDREDRLGACIEGLRLKLRFADDDARATPRYVRSAVENCAASSGLPPPTVSPRPDAARYRVVLEAGGAENHLPRTGPALWTSGSPRIGAERVISSASTNPAKVRTDAEVCAGTAATQGVFTEFHTDMNRQDVWGTTMGTVSIGPMVKRFDDCLRETGYTVEPR